MDIAALPLNSGAQGAAPTFGDPHSALALGRDRHIALSHDVDGFLRLHLAGQHDVEADGDLADEDPVQ